MLVPGLTITLSASPGSTTPGGKVTYTITAKNSGQTDYTGAIITDPLTGLLDDASYGGDATASTGAVSFSSPNLTWTGNLATGATVTVTFSVTVNNPDTGEKLMQNTVTSTAAGSNCAVGSTDSRCTTLVPVLVPGLTIVVTHGASTTTPGATVTYTITVTNSGQTPYTGATFSDALGGVLDDATYNGDAAASTGAVSFTSPNLTWTGDLTVGSAATITFSVTVKNPDTGNDILASTVTSVTPGSNCAGRQHRRTLQRHGQRGRADHREQLRGEHHDARLGGQVHRHLHQLRPGALHRDQGGHRHQRRARRRVPQRGPDGDVGDALAHRHRHLLDREHPGRRDNHRHRHGYRPQPRHREQDPEGHARHHRGRQQLPGGSTDPCCSVSVPVLVPGLSITATASTGAAAPGSTVGYTVTVKNTGQTPYTGATAATFTASLAGMLDDASYRGDAAATSGTVGYVSPNLTWTGDLAPGDSATITFSATVSNPDTGDKTLIVTLASTTTGSNCPAPGPAPGCTVTVAALTPGLTITTTAGAGTAVPGQTVTYTVTVTDSGQTPYTGASLTDAAPPSRPRSSCSTTRCTTTTPPRPAAR